MACRLYRQGDILLEPIPAVPVGCAELPARERKGELVHVLAEGEVSGHAHCIAAGPDIRFLRRQDGSDPLAVGYLALKKLARLVHDEHGAIELPPGNYRVIQQRRYDPGTGLWRRVQD
ncbi:hypothetical protein [Benzoatithermus flavus]|jgi:hypothetical protein|uniref:Uncharacterized protein n=1 Tax=Benzoatithermus flavus TaxID=3108223 RepID=A0ABU8XYE0_9PROT